MQMEIQGSYIFTSPYSLDNKMEIHQPTTLHWHVENGIKCIAMGVEIVTLTAYSWNIIKNTSLNWIASKCQRAQIVYIA